MKRAFGVIIILSILAAASQFLSISSVSTAGLVEDSEAGIESSQPAPKPAAVSPDKPAPEKKSTEQKQPKPKKIKVIKPEKKEAPKPSVSEEVTGAKCDKMCNSGCKQALASDYAVLVLIGSGDSDVDVVSVGIEFFSDITWWKDGQWFLTPYGEIFASYWEGDKGHTGVKSLNDMGASGYLRLARYKKPCAWIRPYADIGVGLHYLTENAISGKELGDQWLAGSNIGAGLMFGKTDRFDLGFRIRHLSNGGTHDNNWGINHVLLRGSLHF